MSVGWMIVDGKREMANKGKAHKKYTCRFRGWLLSLG
jgi:hypothetical protein